MDKAKKLQKGLRSQLLMFDVPQTTNTKEVLTFKARPPTVTLLKPCIIGYLVEPFPMFPLFTTL